MPRKQLDVDRLKRWLDHYADRQGWNESSQRELLLSYIAYYPEQISIQSFRCYLAAHARFERGR